MQNAEFKGGCISSEGNPRDRNGQHTLKSLISRRRAAVDMLIRIYCLAVRSPATMNIDTTVRNLVKFPCRYDR